VVAARKSSRNHGSLNILDKAKEYQKKKNLEVPISFKGNSFAILSHEYLGDISETVDVVIGDSVDDKRSIVQLLIDKELILNHKFSTANPEVVLPQLDDLCCNNQVLDCHNECLGSAKGECLVPDQLSDPESGY
jgi:hypothetical protein